MTPEYAEDPSLVGSTEAEEAFLESTLPQLNDEFESEALLPDLATRVREAIDIPAGRPALRSFSESEFREFERRAEQIARWGEEAGHLFSPQCAYGLATRGISRREELLSFFSPSLDTIPDKWQIKGMVQLCDLLYRVLRNSGRVAIVGDFDTDGATSMATAARALKALGFSVKCFAPDRFEEGYGLCERNIKEALRWGAEAILAVDIGTRNISEIEMAQKRGVPVAIIDHHHVPEGIKNPAEAFINPRQDGCGFEQGILCSAGLTWLAVAALRELILSNERGKGEHFSRADTFNPEELLQLAAIGTVADQVDLVGTNHTLGALGLERINGRHAAPYAGVRALLEACYIEGEVRAEHLSYRIVPILNAFGRVVSREIFGRAGILEAVDLLVTNSMPKARKLAAEGKRINRLRRELEREVTEHAIDEVLKEIHRTGKIPEAIVVVLSPETIRSPILRKNYPLIQGVVGISASRLVEAFKVPAVLGVTNDRGEVKASGRNVSGLERMQGGEIFPPLELDQVLEVLEGEGILKGGGHPGAIGCTFSPRHIDMVREGFIREVSARRSGYQKDLQIYAESEVSLRELKQHGVSIFEEGRLLEPTNSKNYPAFRFLIRDAVIVGVSKLPGGHLILHFRQSDDEGDTVAIGYQFHRLFHPVVERAVDALEKGEDPVRINLACEVTLDGRKKFGHCPDDVRFLICALEESV